MGLNYLSKSKYMRGISCPLLLWYEINRPEVMPLVDAGTQARFDMGHQVGDLAKLLYPSGIEIPWGNGHVQAVQETKQAMKRSVPIFEATFLYESSGGPLLSRADILVPVGGGQWDMIEVKSSNGCKDEHVDDVAFQLRVLAGAGVDIRKAYLMHLNPDYRRQGQVRAEDIFVNTDLTSEAGLLVEGVDERASKLWGMLSRPEPPGVDLVKECGSYKGCDLSGLCWSWLPERHVGELYYGGRRALELMGKGIHRLADIPDDFPLSDKQVIQRETARTGSPYLDPAEIAAFLAGLSYPLFAMDFETIQTAIPLFDGMGTWHQLPFQYSVHAQEVPGKPLQHYSFLADLEGGQRDPRPDFMAGLRTCLGDNGSILVYNATFEKRILRETADVLPEYQDWVHSNVLPRIVDLLDLFRSFAYYHPEQAGSCSLKSVVPCVLGGGYEDLAIADGGTASSEYLRISLENVGQNEMARIRCYLEEYCGKDTESLFQLVETLR